MIFSLNPKLALISLAGLLLSSAISALNGSFSRWLSEQVQDELAQSNAVAEQSLSLVRLTSCGAPATIISKLVGQLDVEMSHDLPIGFTGFTSSYIKID